MAAACDPREYRVHGVRGGHGATTVAGALGLIWGVRVHTQSDWELPWAFGPRAQEPGRNDLSVVDAGIVSRVPSDAAINIVVLRGPSTAALRTLAELAEAVDRLMVLRESWHHITNADVEDAIGLPIEAEVRFTERISRMADAGLLGARLEKLKEFDQLREWAAGEACRNRQLRRPRQ